MSSLSPLSLALFSMLSILIQKIVVIFKSLRIEGKNKTALKMPIGFLRLFYFSII